jgi:hypothetical protein
MPYKEFSGEKHFSTWANYTESYYVDKDNQKYEYGDALLRWDELRDKKPVFYITNTNYKLKPSAGLDIKKEKFIRLSIEGYIKTVFVDGTAKVRLK